MVVYSLSWSGTQVLFKISMFSGHTSTCQDTCGPSKLLSVVHKTYQEDIPFLIIWPFHPVFPALFLLGVKPTIVQFLHHAGPRQSVLLTEAWSVSVWLCRHSRPETGTGLPSHDLPMSTSLLSSSTSPNPLSSENLFLEGREEGIDRSLALFLRFLSPLFHLYGVLWPESLVFWNSKNKGKLFYLLPVFTSFPSIYKSRKTQLVKLGERTKNGGGEIFFLIN